MSKYNDNKFYKRKQQADLRRNSVCGVCVGGGGGGGKEEGLGRRWALDGEESRKVTLRE